MHVVRSGIDVLLAEPPAWQHQRIAMVTNHAATTQHFQTTRLALLQAGFNIVQLFSPEHGLDATGADGRIMPDGMDALTGLPVTSLYGSRLGPSREDLAGIELVLFDMPDIGCRFYTYLWTMTYVMEACAACAIPLVVADRPNPLSGNLLLAEGPLLNEAHCSSFIGRWNMPVRHSCTLGELALYFNASRKIGCTVEVIACTGWRRSMFFTDYGHSFVPCSPAITGFEPALLYPGLCFLEATNISEGRGTATPFRVAGAPWMQSAQTAALFNSMVATNDGPAGVYARPVVFTPVEGKYAARECKGVMLHISDPASFRSVRTGWLLLWLIKDLHPGLFEWAPYPTHVNRTGVDHLDLLAGMRGTEPLFASGLSDFRQEAEKWLSAGEWQESTWPFLIYK